MLEYSSSHRQIDAVTSSIQCSACTVTVVILDPLFFHLTSQSSSFATRCNDYERKPFYPSVSLSPELAGGPQLSSKLPLLREGFVI